jgi:hypothetical protein
MRSASDIAKAWMTHAARGGERPMISSTLSGVYSTITIQRNVSICFYSSGCLSTRDRLIAGPESPCRAIKSDKDTEDITGYRLCVRGVQGGADRGPGRHGQQHHEPRLNAEKDTWHLHVQQGVGSLELYHSSAIIF